MEFDVISTEDSIIIDGEQFFSLLKALAGFRKKIENFPFRRQSTNNKGKTRPVRWLEGGINYRSLRSAARALSCDPARITRTAKYNQKYHTYSKMKPARKGFTFIYINDNYKFRKRKKRKRKYEKA